MHLSYRLHLTNALEPAQDPSGTLEFAIPALAHEAEAVNEIKRGHRFTVVIGNPPYSVSSLNKNEYIEALMTAYKAGLQRERNIQPLSDDYLKFIRLAQYLVDTSGKGVLGFITNHSYLSGVIHRTMRKSLLATFDRIEVTDLHGNSFINEHPPGGIRDSNVFEIQQGVSLFLGSRNTGAATAISFSELWGTGEAKLATLAGPEPRGAHLTISPDPEYAFFVPKDFSEAEVYSRWPSVADVFRINQNGVQTGHDGFSVAFDRKTATQHAMDFLDVDLTDAEVSRRYNLGDNSGWTFAQKRRDLRGTAFNATLLVPYFYRPFDLRHIYYAPALLKRPSPAIMPHLVRGDNVALFAMRKIVPSFACTFFGVVNSVVDHGYFYMGNQGSSSCFPLYIHREELQLGATTDREHNFGRRFCEQLSRSIGVAITDSCLPEGVAPEDIFNYAYGAFHSPSYRSRYAEFLKIEFPRLPLPSSVDLFRDLARLGGELVALHLLQSCKLDHALTEFIGGRSPLVAKVSWSDDTVWINNEQTVGFRGVPDAVWTFQVGGYQVCGKWLKDRKGRVLSKDDITHYQKIVVALHETIRLMKEIDDVIERYGGWPSAFASAESALAESTIP
jgi:predicted helicase